MRIAFIVLIVIAILYYCSRPPETYCIHDFHVDTNHYAFQPTYADNEHNESWDKETIRKEQILINLWMQEDLADKILSECKINAPVGKEVQCVKTATFISKAESNLWNNAFEWNVFGNKAHKGDKLHAVEEFVQAFSKYYYKDKEADPSAFYSPSPSHTPITHYCLSEDSSWSKWYCPNWYKNAKSVYDKLNF